MKRWITGVGVVSLVALVASFLGVRQLLSAVSDDTHEQTFVVAEGSTLKAVARQLEEAGLVRRALAFEVLARWQGSSAELRAGEYGLAPALTPTQILDRLVRGEVQTHELSFPEGLTAAEIARRVEGAGFGSAEDFLSLVTDPTFVAELGVEGLSLEGYLFPETYRFARGVPLRRIIADMVAEYRRAWEPLAPRAAGQGLSPRETLILASIVEKETGAPEERPLIAGVFHNRLARGMRLETDPTVIYGIPDFDGNLRRVHLEDGSNPYNTYRIAGLPPGPIANPGAAALRAAVEPAETDSLFFVSRNDGTHHFSRTFAEHARAVDLYQRRRRAAPAPRPADGSRTQATTESTTP